MRAFVCTACAAVVLSACSGDKHGSSSSTPTAPSATTTFQGTVAGVGGETGTITISIQTAVASATPRGFGGIVVTLHAQVPVNATGTLSLSNGSIVTLVGTFDTSNKRVNLAGQGFTIIGTVSNGNLSGTYTGPGANGGFSTAPGGGSGSGATATYCGTITSPAATGPLSLAVSPTGAVTGVTIASGQSCAVTGQATSSSITLATCDGTTATGSLQGGVAIAGTTNRGGVFSASKDGCTTATNPAAPKTYVGTFSGTWTRINDFGGVVGCTRTGTFSGLLRLTVDQRTDGTVSGSGEASGTGTETSASPNCGSTNGLTGAFGFSNGSVSGTAANLSFSAQTTFPYGETTGTNTLSLSGSLSNGVISGTGTYATFASNSSMGTVSGSTTFPVTLR